MKFPLLVMLFFVMTYLHGLDVGLLVGLVSLPVAAVAELLFSA